MMDFKLLFMVMLLPIMASGVEESWPPADDDKFQEITDLDQPFVCENNRDDANECVEIVERTEVFDVTIPVPCEKDEGAPESDGMSWSMCMQSISRNLTIEECNRHCCDGWERDNTSLCSKEIALNAHNNVEIECQNGGSLLLNSYDTVICNCPNEFTGNYCEIVKNRGTCPLANMLLPNGNCDKYTSCSNDEECPSTEKCCPNLCGSKCFPPINKTCIYEEKQYAIGEDFNPSPCVKCTCLTPDLHLPYGGALCSEKMCESLASLCTNVVKEEDGCCDKCADSNIQTEYNPPIFSNCPEGVIKTFVSASANTAVIDFIPRIVDYLGNLLDYTISQNVFEACDCSEHARNRQLVTVSSEEDSFGRSATCVFMVEILDIYPPKFQSCPATIYALEDDVIDWKEPIVSDNVGLSNMSLISQYSQGSIFPVGQHLVVLVAKDYSGNKATCQFNVKVRQRSPDEPNYSSQTKNDSGISELIITGCVSALACLILLLVIILVFCLCRRTQKKKRMAAKEQHEKSTKNVSHLRKTNYISVFPSNSSSFKTKPAVYFIREPGPSNYNIYSCLSHESNSRHTKCHSMDAYVNRKVYGTTASSMHSFAGSGHSNCETLSQDGESYRTTKDYMNNSDTSRKENITTTNDMLHSINSLACDDCNTEKPHTGYRRPSKILAGFDARHYDC